MNDPLGPWVLSGECFIAVIRPGLADDLPAGLHAVPGPRMVVAARYDQSPVGPYLELAVCEPARRGGHVGMCATTMIVNSAESRRAGRAKWGMPKELGTLDWDADGDARTLTWVDRGLTIRAVPMGPPLPTLVPFRTIHVGADGPSGATARLRGRARLARVAVQSEAGDPLAWISGGHVGVIVSSAQLVMGEACPAPTHRMPVVRTRPVPEPALALAPDSGD